ncbi:sulfatase family protein [Ruania halotolerans]|uniref:sulfatase family protein n=1 Tax=Ruania halotolerans TaxID=2897773 RepID=UPI001E4BF0B6|nr:sulfatase-like hydrolase/transferase [Ruania halotolerans]UFU06076.1 sulfatase-like hydrolase/transferase [Ruania halotolerans]
MGSDCPNVVLVVTDQQRYDSLACYGFDGGHTPNLDHLAGQGAVFDAAYCTSPLCTPSRASMFTGKQVAEHGVEKLYDTLPESEALFTERLRDAGYRTGLFGKLHVSGRADEATRRHPRDGFDVYEWCNEASLDMQSPLHAYDAWLAEKDPEFRERLRGEGRGVLHHPRSVHMSHWIADRALAFIDETAGRQPFFAYLGFFDPHNPFDDYPEEFAEQVGELPPVRPVPDRVPDGLRREMESKTVAAHVAGGDLDAARVGYHASIALLDAEIGQVLDRLDELGLAEDTLVIVTSDHGEMLGDRGLMTKGAFFYEPCVRVPLLLRQPGVVPDGVRVADPVALTDVAATVLRAAGLDTGYLEDVLDLRLLATGETAPHAFVTSSYRNGGVAVGQPTTYFDPPLLATMIRAGRYKLVRYHDPVAPDGQLFDLEADPEEKHDRWEDPSLAHIRADLMAVLLDWQVRQHWCAGPRGGERLPQHTMA